MTRDGDVKVGMAVGGREEETRGEGGEKVARGAGGREGGIRNCITNIVTSDE